MLLKARWEVLRRDELEALELHQVRSVADSLYPEKSEEPAAKQLTNYPNATLLTGCQFLATCESCCAAYIHPQTQQRRHDAVAVSLPRHNHTAASPSPLRIHWP